MVEDKSIYIEENRLMGGIVGAVIGVSDMERSVKFYSEILGYTKVLCPGQDGGISAGKAAKKIIRAIENNKREVLVGGKELLMVGIKRFLPGVCARMARKISAV